MRKPAATLTGIRSKRETSDEIAGGRGMTLSELVALIDQDRRHGNLSSAIRLFVLDHYRQQLTDERGEHSPALTAARAAPTVLRAD